MTEVATAAGVYEILDNFGFHDFEKTEERLRALRWRWRESYKGKPSTWEFLAEKWRDSWYLARSTIDQAREDSHLSSLPASNLNLQLDTQVVSFFVHSNTG